MTERKRETQTELETLYREAGDVEAESGLDRIVRARAEEASGEARKPGRLPWLGGLATASVAIVAIAVVVQQSPPGPSAPDAYMAPSLGAEPDAEPEENAAGEDSSARSDFLRRQSVAPPQMQSRAPESLQDSEQNAEAEMEAPRSRLERREDFDTGKAGIVAERVRDVPAELVEDPARLLAQIEALIERDEIHRARELLEIFGRQFPEHAVPEEIEQALKPPD